MPRGHYGSLPPKPAHQSIPEVCLVTQLMSHAGTLEPFLVYQPELLHGLDLSFPIWERGGCLR
jgi:hypothetical protein